MRHCRTEFALAKMRGKIENENPLECAVSSVVEHYIDTVGVGGSNPPSRTIQYFEDLRRRATMTC